MTYNEIEKEATEWYASQPMGSAVRQNGPAAMEAYITAVRIHQSKLHDLNTKIDLLNREINYLKDQYNEKAPSIRQPKIVTLPQ